MVAVALIPARGGSRGLPGKNLALVAGESLVARAVRVAGAVGRIGEVHVSSDDDEILAEAAAAGARPQRRPAHLATDTAPMREVVSHFLGVCPAADVVVLLPPTAPLRLPEDVERCLDVLEGAAAVATISRVPHPPQWLFHLQDDGTVEPILGWEAVVDLRQEAEPVYHLNGAVYAARADHLRAGGWFVEKGMVGVVMPPERSVDIDDAFGLEVARLLAAESPTTGR